MISKEAKDKIIKKFKTHDGDTGSPQVQIALLSYEIEELSKHLQEHKKDHSSRRGLLKKVGQRRRLLRYLKKDALNEYQKLIKELKLKDTIA
jgi:small subunit ribosomal protein S15